MYLSRVLERLRQRIIRVDVTTRQLNRPARSLTLTDKVIDSLLGYLRNVERLAVDRTLHNSSRGDADACRQGRNGVLAEGERAREVARIFAGLDKDIVPDNDGRLVVDANIVSERRVRRKSGSWCGLGYAASA